MQYRKQLRALGSELHLTAFFTPQMVRLIGKPFTLSIERARRELGYAPFITMDEGMKQIAAALAGRRVAAS